MPTGDKGSIELQIEKWIKREISFADRKLHGACNKIVLKHLNIDRKPQGDVGAWPVRFEEGAEEEIDPLLTAIADAAQKDADDLNQGVQSYAIYAYFPGDQGYVPRKVFRVAASDVEMERDLLPSEPPTEKGLVGQTMRHLESVMKTMTVSMGYLVQSQQNENRRLTEMNEKFAQQQVDMMVLLQDTTDHAHARRLQERKSEVDIAAKESVVAKLEALVPVIINRLAGTPILPEEDKSMMLMASLLESMSPEQQTNLLKGLTDGQRIAMSEILAAYEQKKSKFLEKQKRPVQGLGAKNELPPSPSVTGKKQLSEISPEGLIPESDAQPIPLFMSLSERLEHRPDASERDPVLKKIEDDAATFAQRFRENMKPSKPSGE